VVISTSFRRDAIDNLSCGRVPGSGAGRRGAGLGFLYAALVRLDSSLSPLEILRPRYYIKATDNYDDINIPCLLAPRISTLSAKLTGNLFYACPGGRSLPCARFDADISILRPFEPRVHRSRHSARISALNTAATDNR
jgi:hypothetical protein